MSESGLQARLEAALAARGPDYEPRTRYVDAAGQPEYLNRLILEDSPYLLQHAHNPVNWYAWSGEAFAAAREADKPVFLSIGYATCHWCHVMEEESFDNREVAQHLNENFICIKVDREQRPDIDHYYMTGLLLIAGSGGWPMSSFLTPEGKPFFAGTYFPAAQFVQLLDQIAQTWRDKRDALTEQAQRVDSAIVATQAQREQAGKVDQTLIDRAVADSLSRLDVRLGGFGSAPKFPMESILQLLLDYSLRRPDERVTQAACYSLQAMADGGIHDQIGGGFHRYSVDAQWLVPHFEKMLYNQAQLGGTYLQAWRLTGAGYFRRVTEQTLDYVCAEMQAPEGGFYSATDADSEGEEGRFFVWIPEQVQAILPGELAERALDLYAIKPGGNFEGRSIPQLPVSLSDYAEQNKLDLPELLRDVDAIRELLYHSREQREHPILDNKIIVAWNGMMIASLAQAGHLLDAGRYLESAANSAETLWRKTQREDGSLWRVILDGQASIEAMQEDYASFALACLALYDALGESVWLQRAEQLAGRMISDFADPQGGFYMNPPQDEPPLPRLKDIADAALPSGNALALRALAQLWHRTGKVEYQQHAENLLAACAGQMQHNPTAHASLLVAATEFRDGETGPVRYAGRGAVRAEGQYKDNKLRVRLNIRDGWHVNSLRPDDPALTATGLELTHTDDCSLSGIQADTDANILAGNVQLSAVLQGAPPALLRLNLTLQPCSEEHCLQPETVGLRVMTHAANPATADPANA